MRRKTSFMAIISASLFIAASANAGTADVSSRSGDSMTLEYNDKNQVRMSVPGMGDGYMLVRDNTVYTVSTHGGNTMVMDMRDMMKLGQANTQMSATEAVSVGKVLSLEPAVLNGSSTETLGGIVGKVYKLRYINADGKEEDTIMVLSDDPRALEFRDAMLAMSNAMLEITDKSEQYDNDLGKALDDRNMGVLRWGEDLSVVSLSDRKIDSARFDLPAQPISLDGLGGLGAMLGGAGGANAATDAGEAEESSGGIFSGIMDAVVAPKTDRQAERVEQRTDDEVDKRTDEAVDKVLDKAFGKLFGN